MDVNISEIQHDCEVQRFRENCEHDETILNLKDEIKGLQLRCKSCSICLEHVSFY